MDSNPRSPRKRENGFRDGRRLAFRARSELDGLLKIVDSLSFN
jgi:hypothetical protein